MGEVRSLPQGTAPRRAPKKRSAKVIELDLPTRLNVPPDRILKAAVGKLDGVLLIGFDKEGEPYFASSYADGGDALWLMELCKLALLTAGD